MKIEIILDDCTVFQTMELTGVEAKTVRSELENMLACTLRLCECEGCGKYVPEKETVERDLDLYCKECA